MSQNLPAAVPPKRLHCACGASVHEGARFCWMCGAPIAAQRAETIVIDDDSASHAASQSASRELQWAAWLALPLALAIVYGVYLWQPLYAVLVGPALVLATFAALLHSTVARHATPAPLSTSPSVQPNVRSQRAAKAGSTLLVGVVTFAGTFVATMAIGVVIVAVLIVSVFVALLQLCGVKLF